MASTRVSAAWLAMQASDYGWAFATEARALALLTLSTTGAAMSAAEVGAALGSDSRAAGKVLEALARRGFVARVRTQASAHPLFVWRPTMAGLSAARAAASIGLELAELNDEQVVGWWRSTSSHLTVAFAARPPRPPQRREPRQRAVRDLLDAGLTQRHLERAARAVVDAADVSDDWLQRGGRVATVEWTGSTLTFDQSVRLAAAIGQPDEPLVAITLEEPMPHAYALTAGPFAIEALGTHLPSLTSYALTRQGDDTWLLLHTSRGYLVLAGPPELVAAYQQDPEDAARRFVTTLDLVDQSERVLYEPLTRHLDWSDARP